MASLPFFSDESGVSSLSSRLNFVLQSDPGLRGGAFCAGSVRGEKFSFFFALSRHGLEIEERAAKNHKFKSNSIWQN